MDAKFNKLKKEYKDFIKNNISHIKKLDINNNITKEKCIAINRLYNRIYKSIEKSEQININDINHILADYSKDDSDIDLFKQFIKIKNLYLIKRIVRSSNWDPFISKLNKQIDLNNPNLNSKKTDYLLSKGVYRLLLESVEQFRGCWEIADFTNDKLKKIEIVEPDHFEFLKKYLKSKLI
jgi:hypothetical protein